MRAILNPLRIAYCYESPRLEGNFFNETLTANLYKQVVEKLSFIQCMSGEAVDF
jgi:hypothetical protein